MYNKSVCCCRTFIIVIRLFWKPSARGHLETVWAGPIIVYYIIDDDDVHAAGKPSRTNIIILGLHNNKTYVYFSLSFLQHRFRVNFALSSTKFIFPSLKYFPTNRTRILKTIFFEKSE